MQEKESRTIEDNPEMECDSTDQLECKPSRKAKIITYSILIMVCVAFLYSLSLAGKSGQVLYVILPAGVVFSIGLGYFVGEKAAYLLLAYGAYKCIQSLFSQEKKDWVLFLIVVVAVGLCFAGDLFGRKYPQLKQKMARYW